MARAQSSKGLVDILEMHVAQPRELACSTGPKTAVTSFSSAEAHNHQVSLQKGCLQIPFKLKHESAVMSRHIALLNLAYSLLFA